MSARRRQFALGCALVALGLPGCAGLGLHAGGDGSSDVVVRPEAPAAYDVLVAPFIVSTEHITRLRSRERLIAAEIARDAVPR